jgi:RNA polymerase sigma-70 factor (ECF subfamily)
LDERDSLASRLVEGDLAAPGELARRHHAELYRYALVLLRDVSAAEDAVQETFLRAFTALGRYPEERVKALSLRAWLYKITLNVARNALRDGSRETPVAETPEDRTGLHGTEAGREAWMDALEALARLPERQRAAVALRYLADLPYAEISTATGWPEGTCKTLVRRGLEQLRLSMSETGAKGGS